MSSEGTLQVPDFPTIPFIIGDGIGPDLCMRQCVFLIKRWRKYDGKRKITWKEVLAGEKAFNETGEWLPKDTLNVLKEYLVGIKGPLTTPVGGGIRSLNVALQGFGSLCMSTADKMVCGRTFASQTSGICGYGDFS
jgi:isocitrate dehydrogenase